MNTEELFQDYIQSKNLPEDNGIRRILERTEILAFEKRINKNFIDFTANDFLDFYASLCGTIRNFHNFSTAYKGVFNFYIDKYEVVKNPFNNDKLQDGNLHRRLRILNARITNSIFNNAIRDVRNAYTDEYADFIELTMRLFCEGFKNANEVVKMKEKDVNFAEKTVNLGNKSIALSERVLYLLLKVNRLKSVEVDSKIFFVRSYRGSYYKFLLQSKSLDTFDDLSPERMTIKMYNFLQRFVKGKFGYQFRVIDLFYLGFYNYLVGKYGREAVRTLVFCDGRSVKTINLSAEIKNYGFNSGIEVVKKNLIEIVSGEDANYNVNTIET